jgi:LmbE family N-acetylglucosaminyl deacetylase
MTSNTYRDMHRGDDGPSWRLDTPSRVLTVGAHPDDAEFGAGATLARWANDGAEITMCIVTDGSKGSWDPGIDTADLARRRIAEQEAAGAIIGATRFVHLGHVDGELEYSMDLRNEIATQVRLFTPDVVLTHDPWQRYQMHPDHRATGFATVDAVVSAREPLALVDSDLPAHRPGAVLLWSADAPDHVEPVEARWFDRKVEALLEHSSQTGTTMGDAGASEEHRVAFVERLEAWHRSNGAALGVDAAETFKRLTP